MPKPTPTLFYIRHGETDWNAERRLQGRHDIPLNARGRGQASACGDLLRELFDRDGWEPAQFDYVSSPLGRARETMERLRDGLTLDPTGYRTDPRLTEMSFGRWEGLTFPELQAREAEALAARERDAWGYVLPGGESYAQLTARVGAWYDEVARDTVVTAHGGVFRALLAHLGLAARDHASMGEVGQGCVYVFRDGTMARFG